MTGASDEKPVAERGPGRGLGRLSGKGRSCGGGGDRGRGSFHISS